MAMEKNPWKTLGTRKAYENPWFSVFEHEVTNPAGNPGIYGVVSFKNLACGIIPLDENHNTWIVGQFRYALDRYSWEIPMGGVPRGTDPLAGARKELKEETGLIANRWQKILTIDVSNSVTDETGFVYVAEDLEQGETAFDETEQIEVRQLPFSDLLRMTIDGEITDLLSIAGILKLATMRNIAAT